MIKNGQFLDSCISLGAYSSYSVSREEGVVLEEYHKVPKQDSESKEDPVSQSPSITAEKSTEMIIEFQVLIVANTLLCMGMISQEKFHFKCSKLVSAAAGYRPRTYILQHIKRRC